MSNHSFNPFIAKIYGIVEAIIIDSFIFWTRTNSAKDNNYHDGRYWVFGTPEYFAKYYPYLTQRQIKYALKKLVDSGVLLKNNFNNKGYDKTNWYSLSDKILIELNLDKTCLNPMTGLIEQNCPMDRTKLSNGQNKIVQPIPDTKPDTKLTPFKKKNENELIEYEYQETLYQEPKKSKSLTISDLSLNNPHNIPSSMISDWKTSRKAPITQTAWNRLNRELEKCKNDGLDPVELFEKMVAHGWQSISHNWGNDKKHGAPKESYFDNESIAWGKDMDKDIF